jgi:hypothetical protein
MARACTVCSRSSRKAASDPSRSLRAWRKNPRIGRRQEQTVGRAIPGRTGKPFFDTLNPALEAGHGATHVRRLLLASAGAVFRGVPIIDAHLFLRAVLLDRKSAPDNARGAHARAERQHDAYPGEPIHSRMSRSRARMAVDLFFHRASSLGTASTSREDRRGLTSRTPKHGSSGATGYRQQGYPTWSTRVPDSVDKGTRLGRQGYPTWSTRVPDLVDKGTRLGRQGYSTWSTRVPDLVNKGTRLGQQGYPTWSTRVPDLVDKGTRLGRQGYSTWSTRVLDLVDKGTRLGRQGYSTWSTRVLDLVDKGTRLGRQGYSTWSTRVPDLVDKGTRLGRQGYSTWSTRVLDLVDKGTRLGRQGYPTWSTRVPDLSRGMIAFGT